MARVAASAAAEVGDAVRAAVVEFTTAKMKSVPSGPSRCSICVRRLGMWSSIVDGTDTHSGMRPSLSTLPVTASPKPAAATAAAAVRATTTSSSPGRVVGHFRGMLETARRSASLTTFNSSADDGPSSSTVTTTRPIAELSDASHTPGVARTAASTSARTSRPFSASSPRTSIQ
jgi:hypothetical protein